MGNQMSIDNLAEHVKKTLFEDFARNTNSDTKFNVIHKRTFCDYL